MKIGILGISADPPHRGHEILVASMMKSKKFDKLILYLTGKRKDKQYVHSDHRVAMTELAFGRFRFKTEFIIRYSDAYSENTPTIILLKKLQEEFPEDEIVFIIGSDLVLKRKKWGNKCEIQAFWVDGERLMKEFSFFVIPRASYPVTDLPEHFECFEKIIPNISSTEIRQCIKNNEEFMEYVSIDVASYIYKYKLYQ